MGAAIFQPDPLLSRAAPVADQGFSVQSLLAPPRPSFRSDRIAADGSGHSDGTLRALGLQEDSGATAQAEYGDPPGGSGGMADGPTPSDAAAWPDQGANATGLAEGSSADTPAQRHIEALLAERYREGFEEGLAQGAQLALAQLPGAQAPGGSESGTVVDAELSAVLQAVGRAVLDLRGSDAAEARFEPLKRLALHLAVELVRTELTLSPQAIEALVQRCVQALGVQGESVVVELHPDDLHGLQAMVEGQAIAAEHARAALQGVQWRADEKLARGSVRARSEESAVEDLIENRLAGLVRDLRIEAQRWQADQTRLQAQIDAALLQPQDGIADPTAPHPVDGEGERGDD